MSKIELNDAELTYIVQAIRIKDAIENKNSDALIDKFRKIMAERVAKEYAKEFR